MEVERMRRKDYFEKLCLLLSVAFLFTMMTAVDLYRCRAIFASLNDPEGFGPRFCGGGQESQALSGFDPLRTDSNRIARGRLWSRLL